MKRSLYSVSRCATRPSLCLSICARTFLSIRSSAQPRLLANARIAKATSPVVNRTPFFARWRPLRGCAFSSPVPAILRKFTSPLKVESDIAGPAASVDRAAFDTHGDTSWAEIPTGSRLLPYFTACYPLSRAGAAITVRARASFIARQTPLDRRQRPFASSRERDVAVLQRDRADALARCRKERIEHGRRSHEDRRLADAAPESARRHNDRFDF